MTKIDLRAELKHLYSPSAKQAQLVDVPRLNFAMIDGQIEPGEAPGTSPGFQNAIGALYGLAYTLKFTSKLRRDNPVDYQVMPLEGLWWTDSGSFDFEHKDEWRWTLMIVQPDHVDQAMYREALADLKRKRGDDAALEQTRLDSFTEGLCIQMMHIGPYADEPRTIEAMHAFARQHGYELAGRHHEIYLGDPRRAKPERLKTILRIPVVREA